MKSIYDKGEYSPFFIIVSWSQELSKGPHGGGTLAPKFILVI